jgi:hypothetical protein
LLVGHAINPSRSRRPADWSPVILVSGVEIPLVGLTNSTPTDPRRTGVNEPDGKRMQAQTLPTLAEA